MESRQIGVLGLQGDFAAHIRLLDDLESPSLIVKKAEQLDQVDGLIVPGGESTTLIKLIDAFDLWAPLREFAATGKPLLGTCAGMILLAGEVLNPPQRSLGLIDVTVERNSYGRQRESFEASGTFSPDGEETDLHMVFIRAPRLVRLGPAVQSLATCRDDCVMARQEQILVASFHPELSGDPAVHRYFLSMVAD